MPDEQRAFWKWIIAGVVFALGAAAFFYLKNEPPHSTAAGISPSAKPILAPDDEVHSNYAGSSSCEECHADEHAKWKTSNHGLAERNLDPASDHAYFRTEMESVKSQPFVDADGLAKIIDQNKAGVPETFSFVRVIGNEPLRQYLIPGPGGRYQAHSTAVDSNKRDWFSIHDEPRSPGEWGHWTGQGMNWNSMCAACHNTRLRKNYQPQTNSYRTSMAEMGVSCEACHGPRKEHVNQHKSHQQGSPKAPVPAVQTRDQMNETCAACHSHRAELTGDMIPGEPFDDHFSLSVTDGSDSFYEDGQIHGEVYEHSSFISSRMFHVGVRCVDCHDSHSGEIVSPGNRLCMNCHSGGRADFPSAPVIDPTAHSRHGENSLGNSCVACHMPTTTYMQRDPRHDHGFTIPDPKLTKEFLVPNACNRCHTDKDTEWAIAAYKAQYGDKPDRPTRIRARLVGLARRGDPAARDGLIGLLQKEPIPAWQATACHLLEQWALEPRVISVLLTQISNKSPLVREVAVRLLGHSVRENDIAVVDALQPLLDDPSRSVRIAAAWSLSAKLDLNLRAGRELVHMLDLRADQPVGRMQLGQFAALRGDNPGALRQMKKAIEWDPNSPAFRHDLAILLSTMGNPQAATEELSRAVALDPTNAEYRFKLALSLHETGDFDKTASALLESVRLDPEHARAWYNLGLLRSSTNQPEEAIDAFRRGESADPDDPAIPYARATVHARLGHKGEAMAAAKQAVRLRADYSEAKQLIQALSR